MRDRRNSGVTPESLAAQGGYEGDLETGAVVPPVHAATTFRRGDDYGPPPQGDYLRNASPTGRHVEDLLVRLEGAEAGLVFASGMAAATAVVMALRPGDHLLLQDPLYWGFRGWALDFCRDWGIELETIDATDPDAVAAKIRPGRTKLVWIETPGNPVMQVVDIAGLARIAHEAGARLAVDSTMATPVLQRPLEHGADIVMHSATKYLNGHSDVLAGALLTRQADDFWQRIERHRSQAGATLGPFEAWLLHRGLRTLFVRVRQATATAGWLANQLSKHAGVEAVLYPGRPDHPQHDLARRQMPDGFGAMLSLLVKGSEKQAVDVVRACRVFVPATSLGSTESLIEHRPTIEGGDSPIPRNLIRLSIGLEDRRDLFVDLDQALRQALK
ncbi:trans-sulfuration enzyme family protein [Fodinicurvata fenggangensis]|uniref:trans-sulfuration enzyme family protein n=1 Tax=Fodinicurvata fenggangensis TaxID=1121830 RepID=UPI00047C197B|nr:PLP-dependent aspartate aminotransferase family protein [Fodinicurvata fenggangensis]